MLKRKNGVLKELKADKGIKIGNPSIVFVGSGGKGQELISERRRSCKKKKNFLYIDEGCSVLGGIGGE